MCKSLDRFSSFGNKITYYILILHVKEQFMQDSLHKCGWICGWQKEVENFEWTKSKDLNKNRI